MFDHYLRCWNLTPDGEPITTPTSGLLPVRRRSLAAMLKIALIEEERLGNRLMKWWAGRGAALVLEYEGDAILMERAEAGPSLATLARNQEDDGATRIICSVAARLHAAGEQPPPPLLPLADWFAALPRAAAARGGVLLVAARIASELLASPRESAVLHGDLHHGNVLNFGPRGWLAIDPKGLMGERCFDYANIFYNPDPWTAGSRRRLMRQVKVVTEAAHAEGRRLLEWIVAWGGLSAAFSIEDGQSPDGALAVADLAAAELGG